MGNPKPPDIPPEVVQALIKQVMEGTGTFAGEGPPPDMSGVTIDMSQMHNLDHSWWRCHAPGGRRRHWQVWWTFHGRERLRAATLCRFGFHDTVTAWKMREGVALARRVECRACRRTGREVPM